MINKIFTMLDEKIFDEPDVCEFLNDGGCVVIEESDNKFTIDDMPHLYLFIDENTGTFAVTKQINKDGELAFIIFDLN